VINLEEMLAKYFRDGKAKGFSHEYIRDVLIRKGYDSRQVHMVYNNLRYEHVKAPLTTADALPAQPVRDNSYNKFNHEPSKGSLVKPALYAFIVAAVIGVLFFFSVGLLGNNSGPESITGAAVVEPEEAEQAQEKLDQVVVLNDDIDRKQANINQLMTELRNRDLAIEERDRLIQEQMEQIDDIQKDIEMQQNNVRQLLWDLFRDLLEMPSKFNQ